MRITDYWIDSKGFHWVEVLDDYGTICHYKQRKGE